MRRILLTAMLPWAAAAHLAAQAQPSTLHVEGVGEPVSVSVVTHRGYPAYPAWALRSLGARVDGTPRGARVILASDTIEFDAGSPFFRAAGRHAQLVASPYREGGVFYLPHQFFADWLPRRYPDQIAFDAGRLRLRTASPTAATPPAATTPAATPPAARPPGQAARPAPPPLGRPANVPVVVIDPGHGGPDPGRVGPGGLREKDVVLQVSKRLAEVLTERGYEVRMTRMTDTLINLDDRSHMANEWRGSRPGLFLSIHANGVSDRRVQGFETFFLSDARTEDERRVAEMENAAMAYETHDRVVPTDELALILNNLRNDYYIRASHGLAGLIQDAFSQFHTGANRGVKQAGFRVLIGAFMPAVLIELGFISNPQEERMLGSGRFQVQAAHGIADAVDRFFHKERELWGGL